MLTCTHCGKSFSYERTLARHLQFYHLPARSSSRIINTQIGKRQEPPAVQRVVLKFSRSVDEQQYPEVVREPLAQEQPHSQEHFHASLLEASFDDNEYMETSFSPDDYQPNDNIYEEATNEQSVEVNDVLNTQDLVQTPVQLPVQATEAPVQDQVNDETNRVEPVAQPEQLPQVEQELRIAEPTNDDGFIAQEIEIMLEEPGNDAVETEEDSEYHEEYANEEEDDETLPYVGFTDFLEMMRRPDSYINWTNFNNPNSKLKLETPTMTASELKVDLDGVWFDCSGLEASRLGIDDGNVKFQLTPKQISKRDKNLIKLADEEEMVPVYKTTHTHVMKLDIWLGCIDVYAIHQDESREEIRARFQNAMRAAVLNSEAQYSQF